MVFPEETNASLIRDGQNCLKPNRRLLDYSSTLQASSQSEFS